MLVEDLPDCYDRLKVYYFCLKCREKIEGGTYDDLQMQYLWKKRENQFPN